MALNFGPVLVGYGQQQDFGSVCEASRIVLPSSGGWPFFKTPSRRFHSFLTRCLDTAIGDIHAS
jgi:hypothetical protein